MFTMLYNAEIMIYRIKISEKPPETADCDCI